MREAAGAAPSARPTRRSRSPGSSGWRSSSTTGITATAPTRRPATRKRSAPEPTSSSWSTPTISTTRGSSLRSSSRSSAARPTWCWLTAQDGLGAPAGDAVVEVRLEPLPHGAREPGVPPPALGVPHRIPRVSPRGARARELRPELRRLRLRPGDHRAGRGRALPDREIAVPTRYFPEASSASFWASITYGLSILVLLARYVLHRRELLRTRRFDSLRGRYTRLAPPERVAARARS